MNLSKLFAIQKDVDAPYSHIEDRLSKDILWLMEELGELAREWRGHKYRRSDRDQKPRTAEWISCFPCNGTGSLIDSKWKEVRCPNCNGVGSVESDTNPLLEEYTDCLSIILSIGLCEDYGPSYFEEIDLNEIVPDKGLDVNRRLITLFDSAVTVYNDGDTFEYQELLQYFLGLGEMLGFTWEQIEENYITKAEANKRRNTVTNTTK